MSDPVTWENLPKSQTDNTTIGDYIAAQIALHNEDANSHYSAGAALDIHRAADIIDHPASSVQADNLADDVAGMGQKSGVFAQLGQTWSAVTSSPAAVYYCGAYGDAAAPVYVIAGAAGANAYSSDGLTWTAGTVLTNAIIDQIAYHNGTFLLASVGTDTDQLYRGSGNGSWTAITNWSGKKCYGVCWDGSRFVAAFWQTVDSPTDMSFYTSTDGITWTYVAHHALTSPQASLTYSGHGTYFMTTSSKLVFTNDLSTWYTAWSETGSECLPPVTANGLVLVNADIYTDVYVETSIDTYDYPIYQYYTLYCDDGFSVAQNGPVFGGTLYQLAHHSETYIAALSGTGQNAVALSPNGITWTLVQVPVSGDTHAVIAGPDKFIAVGGNGLSNNIAYSLYA